MTDEQKEATKLAKAELKAEKEQKKADDKVAAEKQKADVKAEKERIKAEEKEKAEAEKAEADRLKAEEKENAEAEKAEAARLEAEEKAKADALAEAHKGKSVVTVPFVMQTSRNASVAHFGQITATRYTLNRGMWHEVDPLDAEYFEKKTKKNATWQVEWRERVETRKAHFFLFKGTDENPAGITFPMFDHSDDDKKRQERTYRFNKDEWVEVLPEDADRLALKAMNNRKYEYKTESVEVDA